MKKLILAVLKRSACLLAAVTLSLLSVKCDDSCAAIGPKGAAHIALVGMSCVIAALYYRAWELLSWYRNARQFKLMRNNTESSMQGIYTVDEEYENTSVPEPEPSLLPNPPQMRYDNEKIWSHVIGVGIASYFLIHSIQFHSGATVVASISSWTFVMVLEYFDTMRSAGKSIAIHAGRILQICLGVACCVIIIVLKSCAENDSHSHLYSVPSTVIAALVPFLYFNAATSHALEEDVLSISTPVTVIVSICGIIAASSETGPTAVLQYATFDWWRSIRLLFLSPVAVLATLYFTVKMLRELRTWTVAASLLLAVTIQSQNNIAIGLAAGCFCIDMFY